MNLSTVAGRFTLERLAGRGGMGAVYQARDLVTGGAVALKLLAGVGASDSARFSFEARTLARLEHPGIVRHVAHGLTEIGAPYLAMEWLEGHDLAARLAQAPLALKETLAIAGQVAQALAAAHALGLIHRDIKPANLFLVAGDPERVKLLDFGIARLTGPAGSRPFDPLTRHGTILGTPCYMAPEQARGEAGIDGRADLFALGCVLFECLTGRVPFAGESAVAVLTHILLDPRPRLSALLRGVPPALELLIDRMLAVDPKRRPAGALEVARVIAELTLPPEARARRESAPLVARPHALTVAEQRLGSVLLVRDARLPALVPRAEWARMATLSMTAAVVSTDDQVTVPLLRVLGAAMAQGARAVRIDSGLLVIHVAAGGAATELAARAAHLALALARAAPEASIAIASGRTATAHQALGSRDPMDGSHGEAPGGPIARAAAMLEAQSDQPKAVRIDTLTAELLGDRFALGPEPATDGAGRLLAGIREARPASTTRRTLLGRTSPCVGREHELGALSSLLDECCGNEVARAALVTAPAGIGKSRLCHEFLRAVRARGGPALWSAFGDPLAQGSAFALLGQVIGSAAGLGGGEAPDERRLALQALVARHLVGEEAETVAELCGELADTPFPDHQRPLLRSLRQDPRLMGHRTRAAFLRLLGAELAVHPVLIVLEDLHWGDLPTVKFLDEALASLHDRPLLVVAFARPEVHEVFPRLWSERPLVEIRLPPLGRRASETLVRAMLALADEGTIARIVEQAAGNAFYLEELIRVVAQGRPGELPETVMSMIELRFEEFDPEARRILRAASVFGPVFWRGGVTALVGGDGARGELGQRVRQWIDELVEREIITPRGRSRFPGEEEYAFRHALVRESAYTTLTGDDRGLGHRLAGEWLERAGERDPVVLAEHCERGGEAARAVPLYRRAAEEALDGHDFDAAVQRAERGVAAGAAGQELGLLRQIEATAHFTFRVKGEEAERHGIAALALLPVGSPAWCKAAQVVIMVAGSLGHTRPFVDVANALLATEWGAEVTGAQIQLAAVVGLTFTLLGMTAEARTVFDRVERAAGVGERDLLAAARIAFVRGWRAGYLDLDVWVHFVRLREALALARQLGDPVMECWFVTQVGMAEEVLGAIDEAVASFDQALALAHRLGLEPELAFAESCRNQTLALKVRDPAAGAKLAEAQRLLCATVRARRDPYYRMNCQAQLAWLLARVGALEEARQEAERALDDCFSPIVRAHVLGTLARIHVDAGRPKEALDAARGARATFDLAPAPYSFSMVNAVLPEALLLAGRESEARVEAAAACRRLRAYAARIEDQRVRERFLGGVSENARLFAFAERWPSD